MENENKPDNHSGKTTTVIVNGRPKEVNSKELSFADVVALSGLPSGPNTLFTVTYTKGDDHRPQGTLVEGQSVKVKKGMVFNVSPTDRS